MTSGSETRRRQDRITIRFSQPELARLEENATRAGISVSSFARQVLVQTPPSRSARRPHIEKQLLARTLGQLGKIGSNVNQIARVLNATRPRERESAAIEEDIKRAATELTAMRNLILQALGRQVEG